MEAIGVEAEAVGKYTASTSLVSAIAFSITRKFEICDDARVVRVLISL